MNKPLLLIASQLIPIIVFLVVDMLWQDSFWAIVAALVYIIGQAIVYYYREGKFDPLMLVDLLLISALGGASLLTKNQLFFLLKPAILEAVMVPYLLFLGLAREEIIQRYFSRMMPHAQKPVWPLAALNMIRRMLIIMSLLVLLHAGLIVFAAYRLTHGQWGLISGPGFYFIFVPLLGWALWQRRRNKLSA